MTDWQELEKKYYMQVVGRVPVTLVRGEGALVWDDNGKEYLDFVAGWAVDSLGHCHPVLTDALTKQAQTLIQTSNQFFTVPQVQLAELLVKNSCLDRVFLCNSGLEANEGAVKLARRYGHLKLNGAYEVITAFNSFHGRSLAMTAATGQEKFHTPYAPLPVGFINIPYNDLTAIKSATSEKTCAVMLEPVQGEGGVNVPGDGYFKQVREWCDSRGILLVLDEIQTGVCRLGPLWGYQLYGIEPDIMTLAKGMGSGIPIGAVLAKENCSVFAVGDHGSTFGGNPVTCAAACATLKYILDNGFQSHVEDIGNYLINKLAVLKEKHSCVTDVRGRGLLIAVEFDEAIAQDVLMACLEKGLLVNRVKPNAIRLMPPLIIGENDVNLAVSIIDEVLGGVDK